MKFTIAGEWIAFGVWGVNPSYKLTFAPSLRPFVAKLKMELNEIAIVNAGSSHGNRSVKRNISHYNLDMIIAIGMRIRSDVATRLRTRRPVARRSPSFRNIAAAK